jgi:hypothetical protein
VRCTCIFDVSTNEPSSRAHRRVLVTGFYGARYIVSMFVMGVPIEARYLVISVCNELLLTPVTDT